MARANSPRRSQLTFTQPTAKAATAPEKETLREIQHIDFARGIGQHALFKKLHLGQIYKMNTWLSQKQCDPPKYVFIFFSATFLFGFSLYLLFFQSGSCRTFNWRLHHMPCSVPCGEAREVLYHRTMGEKRYITLVTCYNMQEAGVEKSERATLVVHLACPHLPLLPLLIIHFFNG